MIFLLTWFFSFETCPLFIYVFWGGVPGKCFKYMVSLPEKKRTWNSVFEGEFVVNLFSFLFHMKEKCSFLFIFSPNLIISTIFWFNVFRKVEIC